MALDTSLPSLLATLTQALTSATESAPEISSISPPKDGISLLDVKNELLLSYLQNLVFLVLLKLRNYNSEDSEDEEEAQKLDNDVVKKLVEMRVYLEKGVRPLEARLKYQIDKVLRAADDAARAAMPQPSKKITRDSDASESESDEDEDDEEQAADIDDLQYRPNPTALIRPASAEEEEKDSRDRGDGIYKPPRIMATAMPTTERKEKADRKPHKSATLDEFISTELSETPFAEPSIGSTIVEGGRRSRSDKERQEAQERKEYEEKNYMRLPKLSKKERKKRGPVKDAGYGGEEWRGLGEGVDRIERLTKRKDGVRTVLEKSRKRAVEDGPRDSGSGPAVGEGFQKRLKTINGGRRDRGRR